MCGGCDAPARDAETKARHCRQPTCTTAHAAPARAWALSCPARSGRGTRPKTASAIAAAPYHDRMTLHDDAAYQAITTHDARFDGRLFVGVTTTRVYCRPVCRVRTPRRENCRFFSN